MKSLREMILANCKTRFDVDGVYYLEKHISQNITKLESESVKVYGCFVPNAESHDRYWFHKTTTSDTHAALLINIEEIKPCEHSPVIKSRQVASIHGAAASLLLGCTIICSKCGEDLEPIGWQKKDRIASHGIQGE